MRASWLTSEASVFTTRPAKLPIEAVPTAFAKDGIIDDENAVRVDWATPPKEPLLLPDHVWGRPTLQPRWPASISAALAWQYTLGPFWFLTRYTP